jgi:tetratricopeptide (TPR) repeat protein
LTEGKTGFSKWSQSFDRSLADVFAVQEEIADAVTSALSVELTNSGSKARKRGTANYAAYDAFLKGNALYQLSDGEPSTRDALAKYEEATALDPGYAAAWSARSRTLAYIANAYLEGSARASTFDRAIAAARKSLELDPELADAHSALAYATLFGKRDVRAARAPFEKSAELGQGESDVLTRYAAYCAFTGEFDKARAAIQRAARLDPLNALAQRSTATIEFAARRYPESIAALRRALAINPELTGAHASIAFAQLMMGQVEEAARSTAAEKNELRRLTAEAMVAQRQGDMGRAEAALRRIDTEFGTGALYEQAQVLSQWGATERGIAVLLRAAETGDPGLVLIKTDPLIDRLRQRPEFSRLLRQAGFS